MYSDKVLGHFHHPRNVGEIENATTVVEVTNPVCGDVMKLWVVVREGKIAEVKFKVAGCVPAVACGSWLTEVMRGKPLAELAALTSEQIESGLGGLPAASHHAAVLAADALKQLLLKLPKSASKTTASLCSTEN
ncbi:MAG: iron-sulfur cluster assembly scaffold protein [Acidobacteriia bacterium]|nr:iron-sulfur cluster assembly scaffold protein [Terriglobia bacterium]